MSLKALTKTKQESGFTLVELLVVILIIGVLSAIAIPAFMNQRQKANTAALETDLKNIATAYQTWLSNPKNTNEKFWDLAGSHVIYAAHPESPVPEDRPTRLWQNIPELPEAKVSPGSLLEVIVIETSSSNGWQRVHEEGEYCLSGTMVNSEYDYVHRTGLGSSHYGRLLYFDQKLGGIKTLDEIVEAHENGKEVSCTGYAVAYLRATGSGQ